MSDRDTSSQTTFNIPSLVAFAVISFFAIRYLFFSSSRNTPSAPLANNAYPATAGASGRRMVPLDKVDSVAAMFPQLSRRDIEWDLQRNGGSVQATTERVLRDGRLSLPPPNFRAQPEPASSSASTSSSHRVAAPQQQPKPRFTDLITRYNLTSRLPSSSPTASTASTIEGGGNAEVGVVRGASADGAVHTPAAAPKEKGGWSTDKVERQALLKRRRDEMVLAARRKLEEKDRTGKGTAA